MESKTLIQKLELHRFRKQKVGFWIGLNNKVKILHHPLPPSV
jgi:hypothetical protein